MRLHDIVVLQSPPRNEGFGGYTLADLYRVSRWMEAAHIPRNSYIVSPQTRLYRAIAQIAAEPDLRRQTERVYAAYRDEIQREYDLLLQSERRTLRIGDVTF